MQGGANTGKVSQRNGCRVGQKGQPIPFNREDTHLKWQWPPSYTNVGRYSMDYTVYMWAR